MFEVNYQITARQDPDGGARVRVTAFSSYGGRYASVSEEIGDEKILKAVSGAFAQALQTVSDSLGKKAVAAAAEALVVATKRGEDI